MTRLSVKGRKRRHRGSKGAKEETRRQRAELNGEISKIIPLHCPRGENHLAAIRTQQNAERQLYKS